MTQAVTSIFSKRAPASQWLVELKKGEGTPLVFIHGWGSNSQVWRAVRSALPGPHCVVELPGCGFNKDERIANLDIFLAELSQQLPKRCVLVGWSLGGMIATRLALLEPEKVVGLVTLATNAHFVASPSWPAAMPQVDFDSFYQSFTERPAKTWARFCALQVQNDSDAKGVLVQLKSLGAPELEQSSPWRSLLDWLLKLDNTKALRQIKCPQYHLLGSEDALVPQSCAELLRGAMGSANSGASAEVLPGVSHALPLSCPHTLSKKLGLFLTSLKPAPFKKREVACSFGKAASEYDRAAQVQRKIASRLLELLSQVNDSAGAEHKLLQNWLDIGAGTGFVAECARERQLPFESLTQVDLATSMLARARQKLPDLNGDYCAADAERLPFKGQCFDLVTSSLMLQWSHQPGRVFAEAHRVLKKGGYWLFATLGPQTLFELKQAWAEQDGFVHVNEFEDWQRLNNELSAAHFKLEYFEETRELQYHPSLIPLLKDLKAIGAHNMNHGRNQGLTAPKRIQKLSESYERFRTDQGLPTTYQVYFVLARKVND